MSKAGELNRLTVSGMVGALLVLGSGPGKTEALSTGLNPVTSPFATAEILLAQAGDPAPAPEGAAPGVEAPVAEDAVPFSELNDALLAARSKLTELTKAADIAKVVGELREQLQTMEAENRQLKSVLSQIQTDNSDLIAAKQAADQQIEELTRTAAEASGEAQRLGGELIQVREELFAQSDTMSAAAEASAGEISRLKQELDTAREQILLAQKQQVEREAEMAELRQVTEDSTLDTARLAKDLDGTITQLAETRTELEATQSAFEEAKMALEVAEGETGILREQLTGSRSENDQLRRQLEITVADLNQIQTQNAGLEQQVAMLKTAAGEAADAARQNLLAVEDQINEINAAFASVNAEELLANPAAGGWGDGDDVPFSLAADGDAESWVPRPSPPRSAAQTPVIPIAADSTALPPGFDSEPDGLDIQTTDGGGTPDGEAAINLASLTTDLPAAQRQDAEALLSTLKATRDERGFSMTVPGALLFAVDSEEIEPSAFDALSDVAELVDIYGQRDVLIVGHTDAVGDANYNQQLSERRAALVKAFFVDNFEIEGARLQIEGKGEQAPIASNATADGRQANRRVEVVILK